MPYEATRPRSRFMRPDGTFPPMAGADGSTDTPTDAPAETGGAGSSTEPKTLTLTQEKLDGIIASRLAQQKAQFSDYDQLKQAADRLAELERQNETEAQKIARERDEAKAAADKAAADLAALQAESLRLKVAMETSLPSQLVARLQGTTEEELRADAASLMELVKPGLPEGSFDGGAQKGQPKNGMTRDEVIHLARTNVRKFNELVDSGQIDLASL